MMGAMAFQIIGVSIVYSTACSGADQRKNQTSASLAFVRGIHRSPVNSSHKGPVTRKMFPFDGVIMILIVLTLGTLLPSVGNGDPIHSIGKKRGKYSLREQLPSFRYYQSKMSMASKARNNRWAFFEERWHKSYINCVVCKIVSSSTEKWNLLDDGMFTNRYNDNGLHWMTVTACQWVLQLILIDKYDGNYLSITETPMRFWCVKYSTHPTFSKLVW